MRHALWRRLHADRDQRRIGGGHFDAARDLPLIQEGRRIVHRPAIGADQHLVAATRDRALSAQAVIAHDPYARAGRPRLALRSRRSCGPDGTRRTSGTLIPLRPAGPIWPGSPFGPWPQPPSANAAKTNTSSAKGIRRRLFTFASTPPQRVEPALAPPHVRYSWRIRNTVAGST
jgi:hypothetical protein